jgi:hypothetical protein
VDRSEFLIRIEELDRDLQNDGVPISGRAFKVFPLLAPDYHQAILGYGIDPDKYPNYVGPNLFKKICEWYVERYGDRVCTPAFFPRVPVLLRGEIYLIRIPIAYGQPEIEILPLVEGLTASMVTSLKNDEIEQIKTAFKEGFALVYEVDDMRFHLDHKGTFALPEPAIQILDKAIEDRETAVNSLDKRLDTNGACFHSQQHAEKMMKGFLLAKNLYTEDQLRRRPFGHDLQKVFEVCLHASGSFAEVTSDVALLKCIPMDVRYNMPKVDVTVAVETIWSALRVGGLSACQVTGFERRHHNPKWVR